MHTGEGLHTFLCTLPSLQHWHSSRWRNRALTNSNSQIIFCNSVDASLPGEPFSWWWTFRLVPDFYYYKSCSNGKDKESLSPSALQGSQFCLSFTLLHRNCPFPQILPQTWVSSPVHLHLPALFLSLFPVRLAKPSQNPTETWGGLAGSWGAEARAPEVVLLP